MTMLDRIEQWCASERIALAPSGAGHSLTTAEGLTLDVASDPARGCVVLSHRWRDAATSGAGRPDVGSLIASVNASRPGLVEVRIDGSDAVISATLFEDGASKHTFVVAVDEVRKARRQLENAIATVTERARAVSALTDLARDLEAVAPAEAPEPAAATPEPPAVAETATPTPAPAETPEQAAEVPQPATAAAAYAPPQPAAEPRWCYVETATEVRDLSGADRVVGTLQPGVWYSAQAETGGWVRVRAADGSLDGWAPAAALRYHPV